MNIFEVVTISEVVLTVFMAATWWWVLRHHEVFIGWRRISSLAAMVLPTLALLVELAVTADVAHYGSLEASDVARPGGGWPALEARLWLWSFFAVGPLSFCGLILAMIGKGSPRGAAAVWSFLVLGSFLVNLILVVNSFH